ncbi:MAG: energy-coupling factor ABC transporter substrate-binding protein [Ardenticatenaceae bacterium]
MNNNTQPKQNNINSWLLLAIVAILAIVPLFLHPESEFGGADGQATDAIAEIQPDVEPWFEPIWSPPGGETEGLLFVLQAAIGAGMIGYFFGLKRGQRQAQESAKIYGERIERR